ncbi:TVP38/TMEM64 family protein [Fictibacillus iocasae]|uniref:TVP38/TMEM64 family membrane protein n=1 Tax=Fictibacillus iocasae TaxID=2715437 RepID=A0ABW2NL50_9BACL
MTEHLLSIMKEMPETAIILSLLLSVVVAVLGMVPSVFITAANILYFGFWEGTALSFAGEAIGAAVSFWLYRKGFKQSFNQKVEKYPKLKRLIETDGMEAVTLIISLRLLPFVPSGIVTFAAAMGRVSTGLFIVASTIGKAPALLLEAYSVNAVTVWGTEGKVVLAVVGFVGICAFFTKSRR